MIFEIGALIGFIFGILFIISIVVGDNDLPRVIMTLGIIIITMTCFVCSFAIPKSLGLEWPEMAPMTGEFWTAYAILWGCFGIDLGVAFLIEECHTKLSERHLWDLQRHIKRLEKQIKEKQERKIIQEKLDALAGGK